MANPDATIAGWVAGARARLVDDLLDIVVARRLDGLGGRPATMALAPDARQLAPTVWLLDMRQRVGGTDWCVYGRPEAAAPDEAFVFQHAVGDHEPIERQVHGAFRAILDRAVDASGLAVYAAKLRDGSLSLPHMLVVLAGSDEAAALRQSILLVRADRREE